MKNIWLNWNAFNTEINGKKIVFFGVAESWFTKTYEKSSPELSYIVDNSPMRIGSSIWVNNDYTSVVVKDPEMLLKDKGSIFIVITSGAYESIIPQLERYGFVAGIDFCCSPALNNLRVISDIHSHKASVLLCSSDHQIYSELDKKSDVGGGLYRYTTADNNVVKLLDGTFHQIIDLDEYYLILDEMKGVLKVNKSFEIEHVFAFESDSRSHGLAVSLKRNEVYVGKSGLDKISVFNLQTFEFIKDINLSNKYERLKCEQHHMNDLVEKDGYLYVSMFSHTGNFPKGVYDGGIMEIDIETGDRTVIINDKWMPHSVCFINNDLTFVDSMNSHLYRGDKKKLGTFSGFIRGIDFDGKYWFVGQSETRYFDRLEGIKDYISMSSGFYLFDEYSKAGKFFQTPQVRQVRNLLVEHKHK